jgi:hypothetical protein
LLVGEDRLALSDPFLPDDLYQDLMFKTGTASLKAQINGSFPEKPVGV